VRVAPVHTLLATCRARLALRVILDITAIPVDWRLLLADAVKVSLRQEA